MFKYSDTIKNEVTSVPIEGAQVYVYPFDDTELVTIKNEAGAALSQPLVTNQEGYFEFWVDDAQYVNIDFLFGGRKVFRDSHVTIGGFGVDRAEAAAERAEDARDLALFGVPYQSAALAAAALSEGQWGFYLVAGEPVKGQKTGGVMVASTSPLIGSDKAGYSDSTVSAALASINIAFATIATTKIPTAVTKITVSDRAGAIFTRRASEPPYNAIAKTQDGNGAWWGLWQGQVITPWHFGATEEPWLTYAGVSSQTAIQRFFDFIADYTCVGADVSGDFRTNGPVRLAPTSESGYVKTTNIVGLMRLRGGVNITNSMIPVGRANTNKAILSIDNIYPNAKAGGFIVSALGGADYNVRLTPCCIRLGAVGRARFTVLEGENAQIWNIWATDVPGVKNSNLMSVECLKGTKGGSGYDFAGRSHTGTVNTITQYGTASSLGQYARLTLSSFGHLPPAALADYSNGTSRKPGDPLGYLAGSSPIFIVFTSGPNAGQRFHVTHVDYAGAAITVYPWPSSATASGDTFRWIFGGGVCVSGSDTNVWQVGKLEASNCGIGLSANMLYGPEIGMALLDAVGVGLHVGGNQNNSSFGTKISSLYWEGADIYILTSSINCDGVISNTFGLDLSKCITTVNPATALGVRGALYPNLQRLKVGRVEGDPITGIRPPANTVGGTATFTLNRPDQIEVFEADTKTIQITVVPDLNAATGIDSCQVFVAGTGAAKEPTGTITFTAAGVAGITVTGGPFSGLTKPGHFVVRHNIAGNTLKVFSLQ